MIFLIFNQLIYLELYAISFWGFIYRRHGCNYFQKLNIDLQTAQQMSSKIINELFAPAIEDIKNAAGKFQTESDKEAQARQDRQCPNHRHHPR